MKKYLITLSLISFAFIAYCQNKPDKKNSLGISIPLVWNNSNGIYYSLGNRQEPKGKAISYGLTINYSRSLKKNWFANFGIGYHKQPFKIVRPFDFNGDTVTNLLYYTKQYEYDCIAFNAGLGYAYTLTKKVKLNGMVTYSLLSSFNQKYVPTRYSGYEHKKTEENSRNLQIGNMLSLSAGLEYLFSKKMSIGVDVVFPVVIKWKDDEIFAKYYYSNDSQQIAENRFSIGAAISCKYHF